MPNIYGDSTTSGSSASSTSGGNSSSAIDPSLTINASQIICTNNYQFVTLAEKQALQNVIEIMGGSVKKTMFTSTYDKNEDGIVDIAETANVALSILWDNIEGRPSISVSDLNIIGINSHTHSNKEVLDLLNVNNNGYLTFNNKVPIDLSSFMLLSTHDLDNDGIPETTGHLRIANLSTPSECETAGFSQTACGFVIEFADIITKHNYNSAESNVGGWPASSMYNYVNTDIYNSLPSDLKNKIIETNVVSGHGSTSGETNFTSIDRVYLFSTKEIWGKEGTSNPVTYDSAEEETRQLDYYSYKNVTTVNNSNRTYAIKEDLSESESYWGLRTAVSIDDASFFRVKNNGSWSYRFSKYLEGISPAFRIAK